MNKLPSTNKFPLLYLSLAFFVCLLLYVSNTQAKVVQHHYDKAYSKLYNYEKSLKRNNGNIYHEESENADSKIGRYEQSKKRKKHKNKNHEDNEASREEVEPNQTIIRNNSPARYRNHHRRPHFFRRRVRPMFSFGPYPRQVTKEYHYHAPSETEKKTFWQNTLDPLRETPELTEQQASYVNSLIDQYEDQLGIFHLSYGKGADRNGAAGISGTYWDIEFNGPHTFNYSGTTMSGIGLKLKGKDLYENGISRTSIQGLFEGRVAGLARDSVSTFFGRAGVKGNVLSDNSSLRSMGPVFGLGYAFHKLDGNYSFHANYDATLYNLGSEEYEATIESHIDSFLRVYLSQVNVDIGGEIDITDFESNNYIYQGFVRVGFRI